MKKLFARWEKHYNRGKYIDIAKKINSRGYWSNFSQQNPDEIKQQGHKNIRNDI